MNNHKQGIFPSVIIGLDQQHTATYFAYHDWDLSNLIGRDICIQYIGPGLCLNCKKPIKTFIREKQNYCYKCFFLLPYTDICMFFPEKCHYHLGTCRDPAWGREHCFQKHFLYLAFSHDYKVGVTRYTNVPRRFVQQGASYVLPILQTTNRLIAGKLEHFLKDRFRHTTHYLKMLKADDIVPEDPEDIYKKREEILQALALEILKYSNDIILIDSNKIKTLHIKYNHHQPPVTKTLNILKDNVIKGRLLGIKGQYLILSTGLLNFSTLDGKECIFEYG